MSTEQPNDRCTDDQGQKSEDQFDRNLVASSMEEEKGTGKCRVCEREGLKILLVRKSVVYKEFKGIDWEKGMDTSTFPAKLEEFKYTYRRVREGYVYLLLESSSGSLDTLAFEVTYEGALRHRPFKDIKGTRPKRLGDSCIQKGDHHKGMYVTIDRSVYNKKAWIAYSPARWSQETLDYYKKEEGERRQRMQELDLSQKQSSQINDKDGFDVYDFMDKKHLVELECNQKRNKEVFDYYKNDKHGTNNSNNEQPKNLSELYQRLRKENAQGIYDEEQTNSFCAGILKEGHTYEVEKLREPFKGYLATAHHFEAFDKEHFRSLKGKNVVGLEIWDPLGLAEEIAVQRRQFQMPIVQQFIEDQIPTFSQLQKYEKQGGINLPEVINAQNKDIISNSLETILREKNSLDTEKPEKRYKNFSLYAQGMIFLPEDIFLQKGKERAGGNIENLSSEDIDKILKEMLHEREEMIRQFFQDQQSKTVNKPLYYFSPEMNLARQQYGQIKSYEQQKIEEKEQEAMIQSKGYPAIFFMTDDTIVGANEYASLHGGKTDLQLTPTVSDNLYIKYQGYDTVAIMNQYIKYGKSQEISDVSNDQKEKIVKIMMKSKSKEFYSPKISPEDLKIIEYPDAVDNTGTKNAKKETNDKVTEHLNSPALVTYEALSKQAEKRLEDYINGFATDYFALCKALFFGNQYRFWVHDVQVNMSDMHLIYMLSLSDILDCNYVGNINVAGEDAFFSLFYQGKDKEMKRGDILSYLLEDIDDNSPTIYNIASGDIEGYEKETQWLKDYIAHYNEKVPSNPAKLMNDLRKNFSKVLKGVHINNIPLGSALIMQMNSIVHNKMIKAFKNANGMSNFDYTKYEAALMKNMNFFNKGLVKRIKLTLTKKELDVFLDFMGENGKIIKRTVKVNGKSGKDLRYKVSFIGYFKDEEHYKTFSRKQVGSRVRLKPDTKKTLPLGKGGGCFLVTALDNMEDAEALARELEANNIRKEKIGSGFSVLNNSLLLIYQAFQIITLNKQLDQLALSDKERADLKRQIAFAYSYAMTGTLMTLADGTKMASLYFKEGETVYGLAKGATKALGQVVGVIMAIDSAGVMITELQGVERGDTNALGSAVTSGITIVLSIIGMFSVANPAILTILALVYVIVSIYRIFHPYDNGLNWEFITAWANRTIFGLMNNANSYPPYPITDTGRYLSNQDYYLASQNAKCVIAGESDSEISMDFSTPSTELYPSQSIEHEGGGGNFQIHGAYYREIRLTVYLPQFLKYKSDFEIKVIIEHEGGVQTILDYGKADSSLEFISSKFNPVYFLEASDTVRYHKSGFKSVYGDYYDNQETSPSKDLSNTDWHKMLEVIGRAPELTASAEVDDQGKGFETKLNKISADPSVLANDTPDQVQEKPILLAIDQYLGRAARVNKLSCYVKYWREGKQEEAIPLLMYHGT